MTFDSLYLSRPSETIKASSINYLWIDAAERDLCAVCNGVGKYPGRSFANTPARVALLSGLFFICFGGGVFRGGCAAVHHGFDFLKQGAEVFRRLVQFLLFAGVAD